MWLDLKPEGRVALVAAASKGLGRAVAKGLAEAGNRVMISSRDPAALERSAEEIKRETGADVAWQPCNVTVAADISRLVEQTVARWGRLDILVTNAGGPPPGAFMDLDDETWQRAFELNLLSAVRLIRAAVPHLRAQGGGRIINVSSVSVKQPIPGLVLSNAIRAGVIGLAKTLSVELAPDNILINNVAPGRIETDRVRQLDEAQARKEGRQAAEIRRQHESGIPLGRYGSPEEYASAVVFLASPAASYITGTTLCVDGGSLRSV